MVLILFWSFIKKKNNGTEISAEVMSIVLITCNNNDQYLANNIEAQKS